MFQPNFLEKIISWRYLGIGIIFLVSVCINLWGSMVFQQALNRSLNAALAFVLVGTASTASFGKFLNPVFENRVITYIGKISYGIYIYHLLMRGCLSNTFTLFWNYISTFGKFSDTIHMLVEFCFISLGTFLVSILSFELFEKRFLHLKKYFTYSTSPLEISSATQ